MFCVWFFPLLWGLPSWYNISRPRLRKHFGLWLQRRYHQRWRQRPGAMKSFREFVLKDGNFFSPEVVWRVFFTTGSGLYRVIGVPMYTIPTKTALDILMPVEDNIRCATWTRCECMQTPPNKIPRAGSITVPCEFARHHTLELGWIVKESSLKCHKWSWTAMNHHPPHRSSCCNYLICFLFLFLILFLFLFLTIPIPITMMIIKRERERERVAAAVLLALAAKQSAKRRLDHAYYRAPRWHAVKALIVLSLRLLMLSSLVIHLWGSDMSQPFEEVPGLQWPKGRTSCAVGGKLLVSHARSWHGNHWKP